MPRSTQNSQATPLVEVEANANRPSSCDVANVEQCFASWGCQCFCCHESTIRRHVLFRSDNGSVVHILNARTSKVPCLMHLLRSLLLAAARHSFSFSAQHIPGVTNSIADALSRFHWQDFRRLAPEAHRHPTPIPPQLLEDLISPL